MNLDGRWLNYLTKGGAFLVAAGLILIALSEAAPWRRAAGLALAGLGVAVAFLPGALTGQFILDPGRDTTDTALGTAVRLWSAVMITIGLGVLAFGLVQMGSPQAAARFANSRSGLGLLLILGGSAVSFYNLTRLLGLQPRDESWRATLSLFSGRLYSLLGILLGLAAVIAGLIMILAPGLPGTLLRELPPLPTPAA